MAYKKWTNWRNGVEVDSRFKMPRLTAAPSDAVEGEQWYNSTTDKVQIYTGAGVSNVGGTAASSLDAAYNGGATITVDAADILFDLNDSTNDYGLVIDNNTNATIDTALEFTTAGGGSSAFTTAIDVSDAGIGTGISLGANDIVSTGGGKINYDNFDMDDATGNTTIGGTGTITGAATFSSTVAIAGAVTSEGAIIIDTDAAEALLVRENGDGADVFTVDNSAGAGDTTFTMTGAAEGTTGKVVNITGSVTSGNVVEINGDALTSGNGLVVSVASGTMEATGSAISVIDADNTDREIFAVRDDGSVYMYGAAEGTTGAEIGLGDFVVTDGDLTVSGGEVSFTDGVTTAGSGLKLTTSMTTAGASTGTAGGLTIIAAAATTGTILSIVGDAVTSGDMIYLDNGGGTLSGGFYINCNDDNTSDFTVGADGAVAVTQQVATSTGLKIDGIWTSGYGIHVDNASGVVASDKALLFLDAGGAVASGGNVLRVATTGTPNAGAIAIEYAGAGDTCQALYIDGDPTAAHLAHIHCGGALTNGLAVLALTNDGTLGTGASLLNLTVGGTPHAAAIAAEIVASKDCQALVIATSAATDSAVEIAGAGAVANNKALLELNWTSTPANAGSNMLRVDGSGGTNTAKPVLVEVLDDSVSTCLSLSSAPTANDVALFTGTGALTNGYSVLHVTSSGALATGGNTLKVSTTGAPASGAVYTELDYSGITDTNENVGLMVNAAGKKVIGLYIDADPIANSVAYIHTDAILAADKAVLELHCNTGANNADSSVLRIHQDLTTGASFGATIIQDDLDVGFINFEGTATADANSPISTHGTSGGTTDFVRCAINGAKAWIAVSTSDPTA